MSLADVIQGVRSIRKEKSKRFLICMRVAISPTSVENFPQKLTKWRRFEKKVLSFFGTYFIQIAAILFILAENFHLR